MTFRRIENETLVSTQGVYGSKVLFKLILNMLLKAKILTQKIIR